MERHDDDAAEEDAVEVSEAYRNPRQEEAT